MYCSRVDCAVSNKTEAMFTFLCLMAMFSAFIDFGTVECGGYGGEKVSWWLVGAAISLLLTQNLQVMMILMARYGGSNIGHT